MTERLYERDSYCKEFKATVESCELIDGFYNIILNRTAFFPEGGGQQCDLGKLNEALVSDVQLVGDNIVHKVDLPLEVGTEVAGVLDWELRFSRMQGHSAEHVVSGIVFSRFGYSNISFNMGERHMRVDFDGELSKEAIEQIEIEANYAVYANHAIRVSFPTQDEISDIQYRSKLDITSGLRLVTIDEVDCCACCAPHLARTGEIGVIKIIDVSYIKKGTRIELVAGIDALRDYSKLNESNKKIMQMLSSPRDNVADMVNKQLEYIEQQTREKNKLTKELAVYKLQPIMIDDSAYSFTDGLSHDDLRYCSNSFAESGIEVCVLFSETGENEYLYVINSKQRNIRSLVKSLNGSFNGKGGGTENYAQGRICGEHEAIEKFVKDALANQ